MLLHHQGLSQADLRREMKVSAATVAVSLARLEKLGFVTRERNRSNQRANVLMLTEKGVEAAICLQGAMQRVGQAALAGFSEEELQNLASFFQRMERNILALCQPALGMDRGKSHDGRHVPDG
ncbi:MAG: MarR family transcriptional regulator [Clostridia bacterium]|nr:MarR family transcriptional regulator [Clostridia bacterium]